MFLQLPTSVSLPHLGMLLLLILKMVSINEGKDSSRNNNRFPLVLNTWAFEEANKAAWNIIISEMNRQMERNQLMTPTTTPNMSRNVALDALVAGCSACERLQCDGTVGFGGSPDENGETTLDAMIMDGGTLNVGAVASLREVKHASQVARLVLEHTEHSLLVGSQATNFAKMMGLPQESLTTSESMDIWSKWYDDNCQPNYWKQVTPNSGEKCGPYTPQDRERCTLEGGEAETCSSESKSLVDERHHDTIGMIVADPIGNIFAGTSTNGAIHKIPGRVGDSPIVGAGAYADAEVGAAVATGDGDILMRFLPTFLAVELMRSGKTVEEAATASLARIQKRYPLVKGAIIVMDRWGNYSADCVGFRSGFPFMVSDLTKGTRMEKVEFCS